jgi:pyrrolysine biosynthesis protein PylC
MLAAVVGGRLQGVEAAYLAHKAGWEVRLLERQPRSPAFGICDQFVQMDVTQRESFRKAVRGVELIIPALEDEEALQGMFREAMQCSIPIALDLNAYRISSSKLRSNRLFSKIGVPKPTAWPECGFPVVVKPSDASGSQGVKVYRSAEEMEEAENPDFSDGSRVIQEFVDGPTFSLEVLGLRGKYFPLQITDLSMDARYDCKRVTAPTILSPERSQDFKGISVEIARALNLTGMMDVEVILKGGELKVLEIDARLPSQTPTAVFWSTGLNMVEMLGSIFDSGDFRIQEAEKTAGVVFQHVAVSPEGLEISGEHIMGTAGPLHVVADFFGADEAITSYDGQRDHWVATLITKEADLSSAKEKMESVMAAIARHSQVQTVVDTSILNI